MKAIAKVVIYYTDGTYQEVGNTYSMQGYPLKTDTYTQGCKVCGLGVNGECTGYYCTRGDCPTRVTS